MMRLLSWLQCVGEVGDGWLVVRCLLRCQVLEDRRKGGRAVLVGVAGERVEK